ncbi:type II toxin-antitoxin system PemK/MazF family toxin [Acidobacteria bacterium AB60]|nr:type II toxin-antitoxin system PemK/MazF family toxin [Acidobacteria bacterium AB60]
MKRGELYRVYKPRTDSKQFRTFVVVSRQTLIDSRFPNLVCAAVMSEGQGLATQVRIGIEEGMKHDSWVHCDDLRNLQRSQLTSYVGSMGPAKMRKLDYALTVALDLPY